MADTVKNRLAGGPHVYIAPQWADPPAITSDTLTAYGWIELPDAVKEVTVKPIHKTVDHLPVWAPHPTGSTSVAVGISSIALMIEESDLDAFNIALPTALLTTIAAGAGQVGTHVLEQPLPADINSAEPVQLILHYTGPEGGWGIVDYYYEAIRNHSQDFKASAGNVRQVGLVFDVFASDAHNQKCHEIVEMIAAL